MSLVPGQRTTAHLEVDLRGRWGPQNFSTILVEETGDRWVCDIKTTVHTRTLFAPRVVHLGLVDPTSETTASAEMQLYGRGLEEIPSAESLEYICSEGLSVAAGATQDAQGEDGVWVRKIPLGIRLQSGLGYGPAAGFVVVKSRQAQAESERRLQIDWNVRTLYEVVPGRTFFTPRDVAQGNLERRVTLRRANGEPFQIREIRISNPALTSYLEGESRPPRPAKEHHLVVRLEPQRMSKPTISGEILVLTDHPVQPQVKIPFAAFRNGEPVNR